jgi:hypothetical protein
MGAGALERYSEVIERVVEGAQAGRRRAGGVGGLGGVAAPSSISHRNTNGNANVYKHEISRKRAVANQPTGVQVRGVAAAVRERPSVFEGILGPSLTLSSSSSSCLDRALIEP